MTSRNQTIEQVLTRLRRGGEVLIASHLSPDGDSIGSQLAIYDLCVALGAKPTIVNHDSAFPKYSFLAKHRLIRVHSGGESFPRFETAVLLEAPDRHRIGDAEKLLQDDCFVINIDHHQGNGLYGQINFVDESAAAVGILVYDLFKAARMPMSRDNADEIYTCILTDTGRFRFSSTNPQAMNIASEMLALGADTKKISDALYANFPENQMRMLGELLSTMEIGHDGRSCLLISDQRLRRQYAADADEMEGLTEYVLYTEGVKVGALLRELEPNRTKVSFRSHDDYDVAALARVHGGGGHRNAAGCNLRMPLEQARATVLTQISELLKNERIPASR